MAGLSCPQDGHTDRQKRTEQQQEDRQEKQDKKRAKHTKQDDENKTGTKQQNGQVSAARLVHDSRTKICSGVRWRRGVKQR